MNRNKSLNRHTIHQWKSLRPLIADKEKGTAEGGVLRQHHWLDGHESEQTPEDSGQRSLVCYSPWGSKESAMTLWLNNNKLQEKYKS